MTQLIPPDAAPEIIECAGYEPVAARCATVTLPIEVLHVVYALQQARNQGRDTALVRLRDWQVDNGIDEHRNRRIIGRGDQT